MKMLRKYMSRLAGLHYRSFMAVLYIIDSKLKRNRVYSQFIWIVSMGRVHLDKDKDLFYQEWAFGRHYFGNITRGYDIYSNGVMSRGVNLFSSYMLNEIEFEDGDFVLDCGANYGDLYVGMKRLNKKINYVGFEPGPEEFKALHMNVVDGIVENIALGEENSIMNFYLKSDTADSSLIAGDELAQVITVEVQKLDDYISRNKIPTVKLLKLEAEGYEPEIILGAMKALPNIEYVSLDGGYERGAKKDETGSAVINILLANNFRVLKINYESQKILFKNKSFEN